VRPVGAVVCADSDPTLRPHGLARAELAKQGGGLADRCHATRDKQVIVATVPTVARVEPHHTHAVDLHA
jgi:hypothetical protein